MLKYDTDLCILMKKMDLIMRDGKLMIKLFSVGVNPSYARWANGCRNGRGLCLYSDKLMYEGNWVFGLII